MIVDPDRVAEEVTARQVLPDLRGRANVAANAVAADNQLADAMGMAEGGPATGFAAACESLGGLQSLVVEPFTQGDQRKYMLTVRRLVIMPTGCVTINTREQVAKKRESETKTIVQPTRKEVAGEVAKLLRYPTGLLRGDVPLTLDALYAPRMPAASNGAASSMKLNSVTGSLRTAVRKMKEAGIT